MRIAVETIPPVFATGMRFMFAAPFFNHHCMVKKKHYLGISSRTTIIQFVICIFYFLFLSHLLMIYGETYMSTLGLPPLSLRNMPVARLMASVLFSK